MAFLGPCPRLRIKAVNGARGPVIAGLFSRNYHLSAIHRIDTRTQAIFSEDSLNIDHA
jgi:hypothetical protein